MLAAGFPAGKSLRIFWPEKGPDIPTSITLSEIPIVICFLTFRILTRAKVFETFGDAKRSCLSATNWVKSWNRGSAPLGSWARRRVASPECFQQFIPAGRSCGPGPQSAPPSPSLSVRREGALPLIYGLLRKSGEVWFPQAGAVPSDTVQPRKRPCGEGGNNRFEVLIGLVLSSVDRSLTLCPGRVSSLM